MNEKVKFLFFCMIFVGGAVFGQNKASDKLFFPPNKGLFTTHIAEPIIFCRFQTIRVTNKFLINCPANADSNSINKKYDFSKAPVVNENFYTQNFGFFCKKELQIEKVTKVPFKFRLGSVQQCDWLEGKPNATKN